MVRTLSAQKRTTILDAALRLFVAEGLQNTSTAEIAREAGIAAGTLFLYFPTKQDLINELVLKISREQSEAIRGLLDPALSARDTFFTIWSGCMRWFLENMEAYQYNQQVRDSGWVVEAVVIESGRYLSYFYEAIQKGLGEGCVKAYPPELIGTFLYQDIVAMMTLLKMQPDPARQDELIQIGFNLFWDGIKSGADAPMGEQQ